MTFEIGWLSRCCHFKESLICLSKDDRFRNQFEGKLALLQNPYQPIQESQTGETTLQDTFQSETEEAEKIWVTDIGALLQISRKTKYSKALCCLKITSLTEIITAKYMILTHHLRICSYTWDQQKNLRTLRGY